MVVQLLEGTSGAFVMLHFAFVILSVLAFNTADGMSSASGWYIFFLSTLAVLVGTGCEGRDGRAGRQHFGGSVDYDGGLPRLVPQAYCSLCPAPAT